MCLAADNQLAADTHSSTDAGAGSGWNWRNWAPTSIQEKVDYVKERWPHVAPIQNVFVADPAPFQCPGAPVGKAYAVHAKCRLAFDVNLYETQGGCAEVAQEIVARVKGENGWKDPHNGGTYDFADMETREQFFNHKDSETLLAYLKALAKNDGEPSEKSPWVLRLQRKTAINQPFPPIPYIDKLNLVLIGTGQGRHNCQISGCSVSPVNT